MNPRRSVVVQLIGQIDYIPHDDFGQIVVRVGKHGGKVCVARDVKYGELVVVAVELDQLPVGRQVQVGQAAPIAIQSREPGILREIQI